MGIRCFEKTFSNPTPIVNNEDGDFRWAPYPSDIVVTGVSGIVVKVTVTLKSWTDPLPNHESFLLEAPDGTSVLFIARAGNEDAISDVDVTIDDEASSQLPESGTITSGTFQPSAYGANSNLPTPAPQTAPYDTALSAFNGKNPNGTWRLWITDEDSGHPALIGGGWELTILSCI